VDCGLTVLESFTWIVKFTVPVGPVAVPVMAPDVAFKVNPAGKLPIVTE
jgi:hypothetical protein